MSGPGLSTTGQVGLANGYQSASVQPMTATLIDRLVARAMALAADAFEHDVAMAELRDLADGDHDALEQAIRTCLAQPASLATRHRAIELLARVRYENPPPPA
jgi:hypothetical protein